MSNSTTIATFERLPRYFDCPKCGAVHRITRELQAEAYRCQVCHATLPPQALAQEFVLPRSKLPIVVLIVLIACLLAAAAGIGYANWYAYHRSDEEWHEVEDTAGEYKILIPYRPQSTSSRPHPHNDSPTMINLRGCTNPDATASYMIGYVDLPDEWLQGASKNQILNDALAWATQHRSENMQYPRRAVFQQEWPGREVTTPFGSQGGMIARAYLVRKRLYVLTARQLDKGCPPELASQFLDSFHLMGGPPRKSANQSRDLDHAHEHAPPGQS